jgi:hypothetical protein
MKIHNILIAIGLEKTVVGRLSDHGFWTSLWEVSQSGKGWEGFRTKKKLNFGIQ